MIPLLAAFLGSFGITFLLTPVCRNLALRCGLVDRPDQARKTHPRPIPRVGGIPILGACLLSVCLLTRTAATANLLAATVVVFAIGLCDDLRSLKPWQKLAGQVAAAALACSAGVRIDNLGSYPVPFWCAVTLTIFWLVGCTNAINLIDGMDGLATGIGLFATLTTLAAALLQGHYALALATAPLAGALFGFLRYNFHPASIFLGDCGSLPLGFLLGAYGVIWSHKSSTILGLTAPLVALSVPLLDTAVSIVRRFLSGRPIFGADRRHIHHLLLDRGFTPRRAALLLYGACGCAAILSLLLGTSPGHYAGPILLLVCVAAWTGVRLLGYVEFDIAGSLLRPRTFRRAIDAQMRLRSLEASLAAATTVEECWTAVRGASKSLGFQRLAMRLDHTLYEELLANCAPEQFWSLDIPLSETEYIRLGHSFQDSVPLNTVEPFAGVLRRSLEPKLRGLHAGVPPDAPVRIIRVRE
jgi:UDP-GlcNAc:undecaprenyl-phosphate/decaprenyl-phosphate GlcNAc-1-phosphate transferase